MGMGKAFISFGTAAVALFIGYATVPSTAESWVVAVLWWGFIVAGALCFLAGLGYLILKARRHQNPLTKRGQTVNEIKTLDWATCDKCGFIGVRNIKTRELEEMEDNQRRTGQPILTRINSLGDTEPSMKQSQNALCRQRISQSYHHFQANHCPYFIYNYHDDALNSKNGKKVPPQRSIRKVLRYQICLSLHAPPNSRFPMRNMDLEWIMGFTSSLFGRSIVPLAQCELRQ